MEGSISTSTSTIRSIHHNFQENTSGNESMSQPSSPRSSALPSPPDSPSSISSFPSLSSSFFSGPSSPPHSQPHSDHTQGLIIPSLILPEALRRPTAYGKTIGEVRLLILGRRGSPDVSSLLLDDNEELVDNGTFEETSYGRTIRPSTDWIEHHDPHGLERFEPTRNIEILELRQYDHGDDVHELIRKIKTLVQVPFHTISEVLVPTSATVSITANLVSSSSTPLSTAFVLVVPPSLTLFEQSIIDALSDEIPIILLARHSSRQYQRQLHKISSFHPFNGPDLRNGIFRSPETLTSLRVEAAERFLRWREVEHTVQHLQSIRKRRGKSFSHSDKDPISISRHWDKSEWEYDWESTLAQGVAERLQEHEAAPPDFDRGSSHNPSRRPDLSPALDPLHIPSLLMFSLSLLGPLKTRVAECFWDFTGSWNVRIALIGGFCFGLGVGLLCSSR